MSNYLFRYSSFDSYNSSSPERSAEYSTVSFDGTNLHYDGVNVRIPLAMVDYPPVSIVVENTNANSVEFGERFLIPYETFDASSLGSDYNVLDFVCFGKRDGALLFIHKDDAKAGTGLQWAIPSYYIITPDLTGAGSFTFNVNRSGKQWRPNGDESGQNKAVVSWEANATISSVAATMGACLSTDGTTAFGTANVTADTVNNTLKVKVEGHSLSTMIVDGDATLTDLSKDTYFMGSAMDSDVSRLFQSNTLQGIFGSFTNGAGVAERWFPPATTVEYAKNGYNLSYMCAGNLTKFIAYYTTNGSASYVAEDSQTPMKAEVFNDCIEGSDEAKALYNKYGGSYEAYMAARMYEQENRRLNGINYISYSNGLTVTERLASVESRDLSGEYIPAYPAAWESYQVVDDKWGHFHLPTNEELAMFVEDSLYAKINGALDKLRTYGLSVTNLSNAFAYWSCGEYGVTTAWYYYGSVGRLYRDNKFFRFRVRPVLAHKI